MDFPGYRSTPCLCVVVDILRTGRGLCADADKLRPWKWTECGHGCSCEVAAIAALPRSLIGQGNGQIVATPWTSTGLEGVHDADIPRTLRDLFADAKT